MRPRWGLSAEDLAALRAQGFVVLKPRFDDSELERIRGFSEEDLLRDSERRVFEEDEQTVRAVHGSFLEIPFFSRLVRDPRLLDLARTALDADVYVHQFKINAKAAKTGAEWEWHQDFTFWHNEDGMPRPNAVNVAMYLDGVNEANGPLQFIYGSHRLGDLDAVEARARELTPDWQRGFAARLKYQIDDVQLTAMLGRSAVVNALGPPGTLVVFDCRVVHGSPPNTSPRARKLIVVAYNRCDNALLETVRRRPAFIANPDPTPLVPSDASTIGS